RWRYLHITGQPSYRGNHAPSSDGNFGSFRGMRFGYDLKFSLRSFEVNFFTNVGNCVILAFPVLEGVLGVFIRNHHEDLLGAIAFRGSLRVKAEVAIRMGAVNGCGQPFRFRISKLTFAPGNELLLSCMRERRRRKTAISDPQNVN